MQHDILKVEDFWIVKLLKETDNEIDKIYLSGSIKNEITSIEVVGYDKLRNIFIGVNRRCYILGNPSPDFLEILKLHGLDLETILDLVKLELRISNLELLLNMKDKKLSRKEFEPYKTGDKVFYHGESAIFQDYLGEVTGTCRIMIVKTNEIKEIPLDDIDRNPPKGKTASK